MHVFPIKAAAAKQREASAEDVAAVRWSQSSPCSSRSCLSEAPQDGNQIELQLDASLEKAARKQ
ncbi:hypothetical protein EYF80_059516 [Liparis tanakae]|uniref:Uncharacterized protein n=1 Tax=Liparis tanakae TaxID=230148 RepID=A0A4Z2EPU4_9TELE|nr:hypothetical protein EYF80_059516 [Liparis tanakae]